jgi:hypothetical protein
MDALPGDRLINGPFDLAGHQASRTDCQYEKRNGEPKMMFGIC